MKRSLILVLFGFVAGDALAGGPNYGVTPGSRDIAGRISEWSVPTLKGWE